MPDDTDTRLTLLERAQLLHDATLRRHGELLDQQAAHMARLADLLEHQQTQMGALQALMAQVVSRQNDHDAAMQHLAQALDAIRDLLRRGNGH